jgi:hypothetical protein
MRDWISADAPGGLISQLGYLVGHHGKSRPASPALADSMAALSESRLIWSEMR